MDGKNMYSFIQKLNFVRVSGTPEEKKAADIVADEVRALGLEPVEEPFATQDGLVTETYIEVTEPYNKIYKAEAARRSGSCDLEAEIKYIEDALDVNLQDTTGKVLLSNVGVNKGNYEKLLSHKPACIITGCGNILDHAEETDLNAGMLRPIMTDGFEDRLVVVTVRMIDLYDMILNKASKMKVRVVSRDIENTSRNITAFIPGTKHPEEIIAFTGHFDSVPFSHGCYDNAAGSAILLELARYYSVNKPERSMRFVWTGSEERGLLGSKHFVKHHEEEVKKTVLCVNVDLAGNVAGHEFAFVTGPDELTHHIDMLMKENGYAVETRTDTYSSDCIPFADSGVPAVSIGRFGAPGMSYIHCRNDIIDWVCAESLERTGNIVKLFVERMDKAVYMPFERKIPDSMVEKVDNYLMKKKK